MSVLTSIGNILTGGLFDKASKLVDELHLSGEEKNEFKLKLEALLQEGDKAARDVLVAEINGKSWLQRNWRPILMMVFTLILFNNYVIIPYVPDAKVLEFPSGFWGLLTVGVGGYIGGRTFEKIKIGGNQ